MGKHPDDTSLFCLGTETLDWYFGLADKVVDTIMLRDVLHIPQGADVHKEVDAILERLWELAMTFADFAGYFTRRYAS